MITKRLFIWNELARVSGLPHLSEMIFILRSDRIFYLPSIKNFVLSQEKDCFDRIVFKLILSFKAF